MRFTVIGYRADIKTSVAMTGAAMLIRWIISLPCALLLSDCAPLPPAKGFIINGEFYHSDFPGSGDHSGEWRRDNYLLECDGYLTRRADKGFCEADVPDDWIPFVFEGHTWYWQPLQELQEHP